MTYLFDDELKALEQKYCKLCGTQRCSGMFDEFWREGCLFFVNAEKKRKND